MWIVIAMTPTASAATPEAQVWTSVFLRAELGPEPMRGPTLWLDLHDRRGASGDGFIVRPGVGFRTGPWSVVAGYGFVPTLVDDADDLVEHRAWQHALWSDTLGEGEHKLGALARLRFEQRVRSDGPGVNLRARLWLRASLPIAGPWAALVWDEGFVRLNEAAWSGPAGFDQNRAFFGLAITPAPWFRAEVGYQANVIARVGIPTLWAHTVSTSLVMVSVPKP